MSVRRRGFTLVEILVVMSIIALLIGLLLPALADARQDANRVACAAQLHSIGQSLQTYLQSTSNNIFPVCPQMPTATHSITVGLVTIINPPPIQSVIGNVPPPTTIPIPNWVPPPNDRENAAVWDCPSDINPFTSLASGKIYPSYFSAEGTSYQYNMDLSGERLQAWTFYPIFQVVGTWVLADFSHFHGASGQASSVNILFADWHVGDARDVMGSSGLPPGN